MARIRTIKPEFFRKGKLQDLEIAHPELKPMLVFAGLWTVADKNGTFPWVPRELKLDILPFIEYDLSASLVLLREALVISQFTTEDGKVYGSIVHWLKHQRINGKEAVDPARFPIASQGSSGETVGKQLGQQEGKGKGKGKGNPG